MSTRLKLSAEEKAYFEQELADSHAVVSFEIVGPYTLHLIFDDNTEQTINFEPVLYGELWGHLRDLDFFNEVFIDRTGVLTWPNGADFNPATLYRWPEIVDELAERARQWGPAYTLPTRSGWKEVPLPPVKAIRERLGLSQEQFANLLGVSERTLQEWEQGRRKPSGAAVTLLRIADQMPEVFDKLVYTRYVEEPWVKQQQPQSLHAEPVA
jgi:putative transcriptional regulator